MRIHFTNIQKPKKAAKAISSIACGVRLSEVQKYVAIISGYRDWHDLEQHHAEEQPKPLDEVMMPDAFLSYFADKTGDLSQALRISYSDALYALSEARLLTSDGLSLDDYETVWSMLFQKFQPPQSGRYAPGTIIKTKQSGVKPEPAYIKSSVSGIELIMNGYIDALLADFEITKPRKPLKPFVPARLKYIQGVWTEKNGAKVLFSRDYKPIWRIREGKRPERISPWQQVSRTDQKMFWDGTNPPWKSISRQREEEDRLLSFGITALPLLVDVLPIILFDSRLKKMNLRKAIELMEHDAKLLKS